MRSLCVALSLLAVAGLSAAAAAYPAMADALNFKVKDIDGKQVDLSQYHGKVVLVVNVASKCGYTPQYQGLEGIYEKYKDQGFVVLGFPCNQFRNQEPGDESAIKQFCSSKYNVSFPLFSKLEVNGPGTSPLYKTLKSNAPTKGDVKWNFEKFLISKDGQVVGRYLSKVTPESKELTSAIEQELKK
jgi:glutathione peroxidase